MRYGGLTEDEALKLITLNPAQQLGIDKRVGSIEIGKDADLAIWTAHPLSVYARVETTFIDGEIFFDRQQDVARRAELDRERAQLEAAEANRPPAAQGTAAPSTSTAPARRRPAHNHDQDSELDTPNKQDNKRDNR